MSNTAAPSLPPDAKPGQKPTNFRWVICGLLFYATTINYIDRAVFGVLASDLQKTIGWRDYQFGLINAGFTLAYALGFILMGRLIDKVGTRVGYAIALTIWSLAGFCTSFARSALGFGIARFCLGLGEAGNFPAAIKTVAEWFPQKQRATATGIFNAGSNVGAILAPFLVPIVVIAWGTHYLNQNVPDHVATATTLVSSATATVATAPVNKGFDPLIFKYGWPAAFFITPALALIWIILWLTFYRTPAISRYANDAERALINADAPAVATGTAPVKWRNVLPHRQAWAFMTGKFLTDPIWWFYLFWAGKFFSEQFGVDLKGLAAPLIYVYVLADVGSVAGGWFSSTLIKRGWTPNAARKTAMTTCAIIILPVICAPLIPRDMAGGMWIAATLIGVAAAAHQGFSANIFTTTSDMFPKRAVSSVTGLGGMTGALGGMIMQAVAGEIKEVTKSYLIMFIIAGSVYVLAIFIFHLLAPQLRRVTDEELEYTPMPRPVSAIIGTVLGFIISVPLSFYFQNQSLTLNNIVAVDLHPLTYAPHGFDISQYFAAIVTGDIFKSLDGTSLIHTLLMVAFITTIAFAILGTLLHGFLFPPRRNDPHKSQLA